jgi:ubiquinone biosynthesis protein
MARELSPAARVKRFADETATALRNLTRLIETAPVAETRDVKAIKGEGSALIGFALGAVVAGAAFLLARYLG